MCVSSRIYVYNQKWQHVINNEWAKAIKLLFLKNAKRKVETWPEVSVVPEIENPGLLHLLLFIILILLYNIRNILWWIYRDGTRARVLSLLLSFQFYSLLEIQGKEETLQEKKDKKQMNVDSEMKKQRKRRKRKWKWRTWGYLKQHLRSKTDGSVLCQAR